MTPNRASIRRRVLVCSTLPILLAALGGTGGVAANSEERVPVTAIVGAVLIDGTGAAPIPGSVVVVAGERIRCAGPVADCPIPAGAERIDASGLWIGPGLIDTHVHVNWSRDPARASLQQAHRLGFGITTVRDAGTGRVEDLLAVRERWNDPRSPTPRLVVSGRASARESGSGNLEERVGRLSGLDVDAIKLKGALSARDVIDTIGAARRHGLPVYGHTWRARTSESFVGEALDAGLGGISHLPSIPLLASRDDAVLPAAPGRDPAPGAWAEWERAIWDAVDPHKQTELIERMVEGGVWLEPLLLESLIGPGYELPADLAYLDRRRSWWRDAVRAVLPGRPPSRAPETAPALGAFLREFRDRGGLILAGSDGRHGYDLHEELRGLVAAGLTRLEALQAATRNAAIALGRGADLGTVEPGKLADLVVWEADPLLSTEHLRRVRWVLKGGVVHAPTALVEPMIAAWRQERWRAWGPRAGWLAGVVLGLGLIRLGYPRLRARAAAAGFAPSSRSISRG